MQERIQKVLKLVEEGKLSAEDAQDLILGLTQAGGQNGAAEFQSATSDAVAEQPRSAVVEEPAEFAHAYHETVSEPTLDGVVEGSSTPPPPPIQEATGNSNPSFSSLTHAIDKIGKDLGNVNWNQVGEQIKDGAVKGVELIKQTADKARAGKLGMLFGEIEKREIILSIGASNEKQLIIENYSGEVKIFGSAAENKLIARGSFKAETRLDAERKAEEYSIMVEESDTSILVRQPDIHNTLIDLELHLMESGPISVKTSHGDISFTGTRSNLSTNSANGDVLVEEHEGNLELESASGDIRLKKVTATLMNVSTQSGDISAEATNGNHNFRTASGDIRVSGSTGRTLAVDAASGDISVEWKEAVSGNFNVRTVSGDVRFIVLPGSNCRVALSTIRGLVSADLHLEQAHREECRISGLLGDGAGNLDLSAVSGNVSLRESHGA